VTGRDQQLVDQLQVALPRLQLILQSTERQHADAAAALDAVATAITLLRRPSPEHPGERHVASLQAAIVRSGRTFAETGFLAGIPEERLRTLAGGEKPTPDEVKALLRTLPDWRA
jgi:hypothetical protein